MENNLRKGRRSKPTTAACREASYMLAGKKRTFAFGKKNPIKGFNPIDEKYYDTNKMDSGAQRHNLISFQYN